MWNLFRVVCIRKYLLLNTNFININNIYLCKQATSLNCMHTFCQFCINQWKKNKVECPVCRAQITTEGRNLLIDNMIDAMVCTLSEEIRNRRKELVKQRQELNVQQPIRKYGVMNGRRDPNISLEIVDIAEAPSTSGRPRRSNTTATGANIGRAGMFLYNQSIPNVWLGLLYWSSCSSAATSASPSGT